MSETPSFVQPIGVAPRQPSNCDAATASDAVDAATTQGDAGNGDAQTRQQLVRYEALFKLLDEMRSLDDVPAVAKLAAQRWKYFANVSVWRLSVPHDTGHLVIDGARGNATVNEVSDLPEWDAHHWRLQHPCLLSLPDLKGSPPQPAHMRGESVRDILIMPFEHKRRCIGLLSAASRDDPLSDLDKKFIRLFGGHLADQIALILLRRQAMERLRNQATRDALTGAFNRGAILEVLSTQLALSACTKQPLSILIADTDHFKVVNDNHGHHAGDEVLRETVRRFNAVTRTSESFGRYGGEEFLFVLYPCSPDEALMAAERIRQSIAESAFTIDKDSGQQLTVTISLGATCTEGSSLPSAEELIRLADTALYQSKSAGRNRATYAPLSVLNGFH